jgi:ATP-dependent DNA helicase RecG
MQPSIEKLQKFFKLEADMGYSNRAVIGGFERIAPSWESEARADQIPEELVQAISDRLRSYGSLSPTSRQESLQGLWRRIQRTIGEGADLQFETKIEQAEIKKESAGVEKPGKKIPVKKAPEPGKPLPAVSPVPVPEGPPAALNASVLTLNGIGPRSAQALERLGIRTLGDMLYYFPRRYVDYSNLKPVNRLWFGEEVTVIGTVENVEIRALRGGKMQMVEALLTDGTGALRLRWFNQTWMAQRLQRTPHISVSGKVDQYLGRLVMVNPEWEPVSQQQLHTNRIVPVYGLTAAISQTTLRKQISSMVSFWAPKVQDPLPDELRQAAGLMDLPNALLQIHYPDSWEHLNSARERLAFEEILYLQLGVLNQKKMWESRSGRIFSVQEDWLESKISSLPFELTNAQRSTLREITADLASGTPMNRLVQGDVGSGKTVVAVLAAAIVAHDGAQTAVMAPTSILAEQHYRSLLGYMATEQAVIEPDQVQLLVGSTPESEKQAIRSGLHQGEIKVIVGTHALLEDPVSFSDLELVIIDEQHRFGVEQRAILRSKGTDPHLLVMTATPIPRSLALTVYGDLDLSVMDEMPPGRQEIETYLIQPAERERVYTLIRSQVNQGRQVFMIYPLVEETDKTEAMAAVEEHKRLQSEVFPQFKIGLLHGRLRPEEKDAVMASFRDGHFQILVSTSVVEVGVDVPNATIMVIEGANRFGLSQLHQFRGRVGRGSFKSYCLLIPDQVDAIENERLKAMIETNDGFQLAEIDLQQRGPGDFLGTRQSGYADLQAANLSDVRLIEKARQFAQQIFTNDPELNAQEHALIRQSMERTWSISRFGEVS